MKCPVIVYKRKIEIEQSEKEKTTKYNKGDTFSERVIEAFLVYSFCSSVTVRVRL